MPSDPDIYDCTLTYINRRTGERNGAAILAMMDHETLTAYVRPFDTPDAIHVITSHARCDLEIPRQVFAAMRPDRHRQPS